MFNKLFKLTSKINGKRPLEDFTTECFVGILLYDQKLFNEFCLEFLGLENETFSIKTQVRFQRSKEPDCIVDIVIESQNQICFIENKVNAKAGWEQLPRYERILDEFASKGKKTNFFYCTKNYDPKNNKKHNFYQYRWFQIAKFLEKRNMENPIIIDFLNFLKQHKMSQDLMITAKNIFVIENIAESIKMIDGYLDRVKPEFVKRFNKGANKVNDGFTTNQIIHFKRLINFVKNVLGEPNDGWSEIKYGFQLNTGKIYCGVWVDKRNSQYTEFREHILERESGFEIIDKPNGFAIEMSAELMKFANDLDGDNKIEAWFIDTFNAIEEMIKNSSHLKWALE